MIPGKEYHFGVIATFDEQACFWRFQATYINGDDSPFYEMDQGEVWSPWGDGQWQRADGFGGTQTEQINYTLLTEAIETAQRRLDRPVNQ